ncbi:multiple epidermal growth factor-like domains protein 10 isoform X1 [Ostrea edulis]|uniref:multiple epidermal growth factor-like domains protein 10 isoform X1 n=1 Tax=Ostrea edulis TaxID=37623 RepID=UPI0024AEECE9|nr:multiple epidermal growth factor-like domains protein 10 isoform X1 [Ostrea edulis]
MPTQPFYIFLFFGMIYISNMGYADVKECMKGYSGPFCEEKCPYPSYGLRCQSICKCTQENCSFENGCFKAISRSGNDTTNTESASETPNSFTFGMKKYIQSQNPVLSKNYSASGSRRTTSPRTNTECKIGYFGPFCERKCPYPSYGLRCQSICQCTQERCSFENGCFQTTFRSENSETTKREMVSEAMDSSISVMKTHILKENLEELENSEASRTCSATATPNENMLDNSMGLIISIVVIFCVGLLLFVIYLRLVLKDYSYRVTTA